MSKSKILFQLSGSIACYKACQVISKLVQNGHEIEVVATRGALEFVGRATLEGLTGRPVHSDVFAPGEYMKHIHLIRWADVIVLCPATANTINKLASGIGDDLLSTLFLAHDFKKPYLMAPAMNTSMFVHPATQSSLEKLKGWGIEVLESPTGALACGETGEGRLLEPEALLIEIEKRIHAPPSADKLRLLITAGGTKIPIDGVRSITNSSSGKTGASLAKYFSAHGYDVTLLRASDSPGVPGIREKTFVTFDDLRESLSRELSTETYDVVIHAAAVSDYSVASIEGDDGPFTPRKGKIDSNSLLTLNLKRTPKLVDSIKSQSKNRSVKVVAFKLTNGSDEAERQNSILRLAQHARPDLIVHNDLSEIDESHHRTTIYSAEKPERLRVVAKAETKTETASSLDRLVRTLVHEGELQ